LKQLSVNAEKYLKSNFIVMQKICIYTLIRNFVYIFLYDIGYVFFLEFTLFNIQKIYLAARKNFLK